MSRLSLVLGCLVSYLAFTDAIFLLGTTAGAGAVTLGSGAGLGLAAGVVGLGALAVGGAILVAAASRRGRGRRGRRRYGRSVAGEDELDAQENLVWELVSSTDQLGCVMKFICLVEADSTSKLSKEEQLVKDLFGSEPEELNAARMREPRAPYEYAAFMGYKFGADACGKLFNSCPVTRPDMDKYLRSLNLF